MKKTTTHLLGPQEIREMIIGHIRDYGDAYVSDAYIRILDGDKELIAELHEDGSGAVFIEVIWAEDEAR